MCGLIGRESALCYHVLQLHTPFLTTLPLRFRQPLKRKATAMQIPASAHFTPIDLASHYNIDRSTLDQPLRTPSDIAATIR